MTQRCEDFFRLFEEKPTIFKYENLITDLIANKENAILILYDDLVIFDPLLAELLRKDPVRIIEHFTKALKNILMFRGEHQASKDDYFIYIDSNDQDGSIFVPLYINLAAGAAVGTLDDPFIHPPPPRRRSAQNSLM